MRIASLDLIRYGRFENREIPFAKGASDFQMIVGPNEAGKTTLRAAISDLLFGFEHNAPYGYRFDNSMLRVGAILEDNNTQLRIRRRKGRAQTLLDADEKPLSDAVLSALLNQKNREFFERMFSLDQQRLVAGGRDLLAAKDDLGRMLFQSAAGVSGFGDALERLTEEADSLWAPRASDKRAYSRAEKRFSEAERTLKEVTLRSLVYREAVKRLDDARSESTLNADQMSKLRVEAQKLRRAQVALPKLTELAETRIKRGALEAAVVLPVDAAERLADAGRDIAVANEAIRSAETLVAEKQEELASLVVDETLIARADEIGRLKDLRSRYEPYPRDIAKREGEILTHQKRADLIVKEFGWEALSEEEIRARLPNRLVRAALQVLAQRQGGLVTAITAADAALDKQKRINTQDVTELETLPDNPPSAALSDALAMARGLGDVARKQTDIKRQCTVAERTMTTALEQLRPWGGTVEALKDIPIPAQSVLSGLRARIEKVEADLRAAGDHRTEDNRALQLARLQAQQIERDDRPVAADDLATARHERNGLWQSIRDRLEQGDADKALGYVEPYQATTRHADALSDRRFDLAERSVALTRARQEVELITHRLAEIDSDITRHTAARNLVIAELAAIQANLGLPRATLADIDNWLRNRLDALKQVVELADKNGTLTQFDRELEQAIAALTVALNGEIDTSDPNRIEMFRRLLREADGLFTEQQTQFQKRNLINDRLRPGTQEAEALEKRRTQVTAALEAWHQEWTTACSKASLDPALRPEQVTAALELMAELEAEIGEIQDLRVTRIGAMRRDLDEFSLQVRELVGATASDLAVKAPTEALDQLAVRLTTAQRIADEALRLRREIIDADKQLQQAQNTHQLAVAQVEPMLRQAGVEDLEALAQVISSSDQCRQFDARIATLENDLIEAGDGLSLADLTTEAHGQDRDLIRARLLEIEDALDLLSNDRQRIGGDIADAEAKLRGMQGSDAASIAAESRQQALADMGDAIERWTRLTVGTRLLRAAIDMYRERKQAPLLQSAERMFATLTLGEFKALRIDYGRADQPVLTAIRHNDEVVPVEGLSTGTADQLFLALRIAALEQYLETASSFPFIVDDLFVNFDDARSAAGFKVLGDLARKTQVVFLTHHAHLAEVARGAIPDQSAPIRLM